jgi:hypothetical protein
VAQAADNSVSGKHHAFIAANWEALAAVAWRGFLFGGRGALRVRESLFMDAVAGDVLLGRVGYAAQQVGPIGELVRGYDPETEIVCTILRPDGTARTYQLRGPVPPPEAYQLAVELGHRES